MSEVRDLPHDGDRAPGTEPEARASGGRLRSYLAGLILTIALTAASFHVLDSGLIWAPGIPIALVVLAVAQMGVHLVFFLHLTSGPDNANNALALAFGILIVGLVFFGSLWIIAHLNHNMMPAASSMSGSF